MVLRVSLLRCQISKQRLWQWQLCGILSLEAILFEMAELLVLESRKPTNSDDDMTHQQHFVDPDDDDAICT